MQGSASDFRACGRRIRRLLAYALLLSLPLACGLDPDAPGNLVPATVDEDSSLPSLLIAGTKLHLQTFGDPSHPAVVFLHGGPGGDFRSLLRLAALHRDGYFCIFYDDRGTGLSRRHDLDELSAHRLFGDLEGVVDHFVAADEQVYLVGHSWGGTIVHSYIARHPERVAGAVLLEPGPPNSHKFVQMEDVAVSADLTAGWASDIGLSNDYISPDSHARLDYQMAIAYPVIEESPDYDPADPVPFWRIGGMLTFAAIERIDEEPGWTFDFRSGLAAFPHKVVFVRGAEGTELDQEYHEGQLEHFQDAQLVVLPGVAHNLMWTAAPRVLDTIRAYLAELSGGPS